MHAALALALLAAAPAEAPVTESFALPDAAGVARRLDDWRGRRLVVVDDTIVRGTTQRALVAMLREADAREVHVRVAAPPVRWPCFYGIDFATRAELIAGQLSPEEICASIGAD